MFLCSLQLQPTRLHQGRLRLPLAHHLPLLCPALARHQVQLAPRDLARGQAPTLGRPHPRHPLLAAAAAVQASLFVSCPSLH